MQVEESDPKYFKRMYNFGDIVHVTLMHDKDNLLGLFDGGNSWL